MAARVWTTSNVRSSKLCAASVLISTSLLFSLQLALAQFTQQGPKLVGTFWVGVWVWIRGSGSILLERVARRDFYGAGALCLLLVGVTGVASAETYTLTDLGMVGLGSAAFAINDTGQVVGWSQSGGAILPTIWNGTTASVLNPLGGYVSGQSAGNAFAVNNAGQAAGYSQTQSTGYLPDHATRALLD